MPHTIMDWFSLLGCMTFIYILVLLALKILYRLTCWGIRKIEARKQEDNYADDSDGGEVNDSR